MYTSAGLNDTLGLQLGARHTRHTPAHHRHRVVASRSARRAPVARRVTSAPVRTPTHHAAPTTTVSGAAGQLVQWINQARASHGLRSVGWNGTLASYSKSHSSSMAARGQLFHTGPSTLMSEGSHSCSCSTAGEIVGKGTSVRQVFDLFMSDASHRAVIMNSAFRYAGAGIVYSHGWYWVTVTFAG